VNILSPWEPGSWLSLWLHFGPWAISIVVFMTFAVIMLIVSVKAERERRALRAWYLGRLEMWRERRRMVEPAALAMAEAFTQRIEIVMIPEPIHSSTDRSE
jgi:hypothetical protein